MDKKCAINPKTGRAVKEGGKIYNKLDTSAKKLQASVRAKLTKKTDPPPKPKMKPKTSPKVDVSNDNWFLPYIEKEASQILQAVIRRSNANKKK